MKLLIKFHTFNAIRVMSQLTATVSHAENYADRDIIIQISYIYF